MTQPLFKTPIFKTLGLATGTSAILLLSALSAQAYAMSPFQASYQFAYNGKNVGTATRTLSQSGNNWNYVFAAKSAGLA